jgi:DNA polymerase-3 subunit delta
VPAWIRDYLKRRNFKITEKAVHMIAEYIGNNLQRLANEIDKMLINFVDPGDTTEPQLMQQESIKETVEEIEDGHVQKYIGISKEYNAFELQRAVILRDIPKAGKIVNYFESNPKNNPVLPVIGVLYSLFSKLLVLHSSKFGTDKEIASILRISPFFVKEYRLGLQNYNLPKVIDNIHHLRKADLMSKGVYNAGVTDGQVLKELVYKLMH